MNSRVALALAISAGMALVVSGIFYQVAVRDGPSEPQPVEIGEVVAAARDLNIGAAIEAADLKIEPWPANRIPDGSFQQIDDVISRVTVNRVLANEPIAERRLALPGSGVGLAPKVPEGMRAMAVRVDDVNGVAGFVLPEARVDVLLTGSPKNRADLGRVTRTILSNVRVISAGEHLAPDASGRPKRVPVVTLLLTLRQAELLTLASSQGRIQLVLRNSMDQEQLETKGVREQELFGELRAVTRVALNGAAFLEQEDETVLRVVDLHPWIAEPAERLFDGGHYSQAILAAAQNLEVQWRKLLGVSDGSLSDLATRSFSPDDPKPGRPRLRFPEAGSDAESGPWKNAHLGAMKYAEGCAMRIRNLNLHHPDDDEPDVGITIETLSALSVLARWITSAKVEAEAPP